MGPTTWGGAVPDATWAPAPPPPPYGGDPVPPGTGEQPPAARRPRGRLIIGLAVVVLILVAAAAAVVATRGGGGSSTATGYGGFPLASGPNGQPSKEERFRVDVDCGEWGCSLAADADRFYVVERGEEDIDTGEVEESEVMAYDAGSGDALWDDPVEAGTGYGVVAIDGLLLLSTDDGTTAIDGADGSEAWSEPGSINGYHDGSVLLVEYDDEGSDVTSTLVDVADGDTLWDTDGSVVVCGDDTMIARDGEDISRIDPGSGDATWTESADDPTAMACSDDVVAYQSGGDEVRVLDMDEGDDIGEIDVDASDDGVALSAQGVDVFTSAGGDTARHRVGGDDIEEIWSEDGPEYAYQHQVIGGDRLLVVDDEDAELFAIDDGESLGKVDISSALTDLSARALIGVEDDGIEAWDLSELEDAWSLDIDDVSEVALGGDRVFVLTDDEVLGFS